MGYEVTRSNVYDFAQSNSYETREKGDELEFRFCPYCNGGHNKDEWTFAINLDRFIFKCLRASCGKQGHFVELCRDFDFRLEQDTARVFRKLPQKKPESKSAAVRYLESRGISEQITRRYNITTQNGHDNVLVFPFYDETNELVSVKYRKTDFKRGIDKNKEWFEKDTMPVLFGMNHCHNFNKPLVITEGQIDSLSLAEAGIENAVSVPTGANGFTWFAYCYTWLSQFKEIIVFGDNEHGSITLIDGITARVPNEMTVKCVRNRDYLGEKDANDILRKFGAKALRFCVEHAEIPSMSNVKDLADVKSVDLSKMDKIRTGIVELDRCIRGMAMGQLVILTGKRGEGKSTFMSQIVAEALDQQRNVFVYSGELRDDHFKRWLDTQLAGEHNVNRTDDEFNEPVYTPKNDALEKINNWYRGRAFIYDNNSLIDGTEFESLPETIEKAIKKYNVQLVCVDNLMTAMETVSEQTNLFLAQSNFVGKLKAIAMKYSVVVILVAHPKKANANEFQDDNDLVAGSSDITNKADIVLKYSRNNNEDLECDSLIKITKNRLMGVLKTRNEDAVRVNYSDKTKRITGVTDAELHGKMYGWELHVTKAEELPF